MRGELRRGRGRLGEERETVGTGENGDGGDRETVEN